MRYCTLNVWRGARRGEDLIEAHRGYSAAILEILCLWQLYLTAGLAASGASSLLEDVTTVGQILSPGRS